jgi:hypothetical protein
MPKNTATKPHAAVDDPVANAKAEVDQLVEFQRRTWDALQSKSREVASRGAAAGDALVDAALRGTAPGMSQAAEGIAHLQAELVVLSEALDAARIRHQAAIPAVGRAQAVGMRIEAAARRAEAEEREVLTLQLLAQLREHEGVVYVPARAMPSDGLVGGERKGGALQVFVVNLPRTALLRDEADALEQTAGNIERQEVHQAGQVVGLTVDDLVNAMFANPMVIGPRPVDIAAWTIEAEKRERQRRIRLAHGGAEAMGYAEPDGPVEFLLTWRQGAIDQRESGARPPEAAFIEVVLAPSPAKGANVPASKPARDTRVRNPFDTGPTSLEISREAANTGQSIEEVAKAWGVPVPKPEPVEA